MFYGNMHNHSNGTFRSSEAEKIVISEIKMVTNFHAIRIMDHIILVPDGNYFSFSDKESI